MELQEINNKISKLSRDVESVKISLKSPKTPETPNPGSLTIPSTSNLNPDTEEILVAAEVHAEPGDISINSIEEFIPENDDLNLLALTNQQDQLMQNI